MAAFSQGLGVPDLEQQKLDQLALCGGVFEAAGKVGDALDNRLALQLGLDPDGMASPARLNREPYDRLADIDWCDYEHAGAHPSKIPDDTQGETILRLGVGQLLSGARRGPDHAVARS